MVRDAVFDRPPAWLNAGYLARVVSLDDPERLNRVQVRLIAFDGIDGQDAPLWARVVAPFAGQPTTIRGIASARVKETDRVAAMCAGPRRLGVRVGVHAVGARAHALGLVLRALHGLASVRRGHDLEALRLQIDLEQLPGIGDVLGDQDQRAIAVFPGYGHYRNIMGDRTAQRQ